MIAQPGDTIVIESQKVGKKPRTGEILEVIESSTGQHFRVLWDDGHESTFWPQGCGMRVIPREARETAKV